MATKLTSMKLTKKEATSSPAPAMPEAPRYPWGLTVDLNDEVLSKLKMTTLPSVEDAFVLVAKVYVKGVRANETAESGKNRNVELQITALCLEDVDDAAEYADVLFGKKT
jgi:hypothetical protein